MPLFVHAQKTFELMFGIYTERLKLACSHFKCWSWYINYLVIWALSSTMVTCSPRTWWRHQAWNWLWLLWVQTYFLIGQDHQVTKITEVKGLSGSLSYTWHVVSDCTSLSFLVALTSFLKFHRGQSSSFKPEFPLISNSCLSLLIW